MALLKHDPEFVSEGKVSAKLHTIAKAQKGKRNKRSVRYGDTKGKPRMHRGIGAAIFGR